MDGNIRVGIRSRPLTSEEILNGSKSSFCCFPQRNEILLGKDKTFTFDYVFDPDTSQESIYNNCTKALLDNVFHGFNATIFAYGQTGSGKTYTMGTADSDSCSRKNLGIIPRLMEDLFREVENRKSCSCFDIKVSFLEIYNEVLIDLLSHNINETLNIREEANEIKIPGLSEVTVSSSSEVLACLARGSQRRSVASTAMNQSSSRSHAIFSVHLAMTDTGSGTVTRSSHLLGDKLRAKFHLVDLAGSERAKKTLAEGGRFREGVKINMGLLALGNVIGALSEGRSHVPYRDSKITRLLRDSLGGNSNTLMLACVSPASTSSEETLNTLRYAHRARQIRNKPVANRVTESLQVEVLKLRGQVSQLQTQLLVTPTEIVHETPIHRSNSAIRVEVSLKSKAIMERLLSLTTSLLSKQHHELFTRGLSSSSMENEYARVVREIESHKAEMPALSDMLRLMSSHSVNSCSISNKSSALTGSSRVTKRRRRQETELSQLDWSSCSSTGTPPSHNTSRVSLINSKTVVRPRLHVVSSMQSLSTPPKTIRPQVDTRTVIRPHRKPSRIYKSPESLSTTPPGSNETSLMDSRIVIDSRTVVRPRCPKVDTRTVCKKRRLLVETEENAVRAPLRQIMNNSSMDLDNDSGISRGLSFDELELKGSILDTSEYSIPMRSSPGHKPCQVARRRSRASIRLAIKRITQNEQQENRVTSSYSHSNRRTSLIPVAAVQISGGGGLAQHQLLPARQGPRHSVLAKLNRHGIPSLFQSNVASRRM